MSATPPEGHEQLFDGGPPLRLLRLWGRFDPQHRRVYRRMAVVALVSWLPLMALALLAKLDGHDAVWNAFLRDASVHVRTLVVAPLLVLGEAICIPYLGALAHEFPRRGIVTPAQMPRYEAIIRSIRALRDTWVVEAIAVLLAWTVALLIVWKIPASFLPDWHRGSPDAPLGRSLASWWHALVSLPILLVLLLGWCWRVVLWARYLRQVSRLNLQLVASHPEGAAGLMFCGESLNAFAVLGVAIGSIVAATELAHLFTGAAVTLDQLGQTAVATVVFVVVILSLPLLSLCGPLLQVRRQGMRRYGALAQQVGAAFEDKWMNERQPVPESDLLSSPDFSAVADLSPSVEKAHGLRLVPIEMRHAAALAIATALPFAIVAVAMAPFDALMAKLLDLFL